MFLKVIYFNYLDDKHFRHYFGLLVAYVSVVLFESSLQIEKNCWNEDWSQKYTAQGRDLPLPQIQQMGRQILEALVFLKERGFPTVTHLHSGNVIVQNGVARLAGLENTLLGFTSRTQPIITSRLAHLSSVDSICFGNENFYC